MYREFNPEILLTVWKIRKNTSLILDICELFQATLDEGLGEIPRAYKAEDSKELVYWLHRMKGSALNVGAVFLADHLQEAKEQVKNLGLDEPTPFSTHLEQIHTSYLNAKHGISALLQSIEDSDLDATCKQSESLH